MSVVAECVGAAGEEGGGCGLSGGAGVDGSVAASESGAVEPA